MVPEPNRPDPSLPESTGDHRALKIFLIVVLSLVLLSYGAVILLWYPG